LHDSHDRTKTAGKTGHDCTAENDSDNWALERPKTRRLGTGAAFTVEPGKVSHDSITMTALRTAATRQQRHDRYDTTVCRARKNTHLLHDLLLKMDC
jgi:hypothetical protein